MTDRTKGVYFEFDHTASSSLPGVRYTFCKIWDVPYAERKKDVTARPIGMGRAQCVPQDNFAKATGRKIAFTRALRCTAFTKPEREKIWAKYFEQMPIGGIRAKLELDEKIKGEMGRVFGLISTNAKTLDEETIRELHENVWELFA